MGMNFQDVIRDVHDPDNHQLKVAASVSASNQVTVQPLSAWPDPKTYIGLVTVTGNLAASLAGNITLNPSPNFIGIVTVANPSSAALSGNVTLDPGSKTGIVGNITLSDPKGFIGLTTVVQASTTRSIVGNVTISDSKGYIGLVTVTQASSARTIIGNLTLSDAKTFIGLVTVGNTVVVQGTAADGAAVAGNPVRVGGSDGTNTRSILTDTAGKTLLGDPKTYIGLVTITGSLSAASGNVTLDAGSKTGIVGNITLSDPKGFIGLVTVVGSLSAAAGNVTLDAGSKTQIVGNITLSDPKGFIGLVTVVGSLSAAAGNVTLDAGSKTGIVGNLTLSDPKGFIGLVTVVGSLSPAAGNVTLDAGSKTGIVGNVTLSDSKTFIGLVTATLGVSTTFIGFTGLAVGENFVGLTTTVLANTSIQSFGQFFPVLQSIASGGLGPIALDNFGRIQTTLTGNVTISDSKGYIGLVTVTQASSARSIVGNITIDSGNISIKGNVTLSDPKTGIGLVSIFGGSLGIVGNVTLSDSKGYIGLVTVIQASAARTITGNVTLSDAKTYIGLTTATLGIGTTFIGLVTANAINAGTNKTILSLPIGFAAASVTTIAVPTNANRIKVTNLLLNSDATVRIAIKSGVTYLTGNASIGVTLNPGGGFPLIGSPDSPSWLGLPSGALIVEKFDLTATSAKIGGHVLYFDEA